MPPHYPRDRPLARRLRRALGTLGVAAAGLAAGLPGQALADAGAGPAGPSLTVHLDDGLLTAEVRDVRIIELLRLLSQKAGFRLAIPGGVEGTRLTETVSFALSRVPLEEVIRRTSPDISFAAIFGPDGATPVELIVLDAGRGVGRGDPAAEAAPSAEDAAAASYEARKDRRLEAREEILIRNEQSVGELTYTVNFHADPVIRQMGVMALSRFDEAAAKEALSDVVFDPDEAVASEAILVLGHFWGAEAADILDEVAYAHDDPAVRGKAFLMLETIERIESGELPAAR